ncbi:MAG: squalene--hopene cyclase [Planctomycetes bacterium]|nr:squalene--hopene cyclase [Planctomycetota bacterium]
MPRRTSIAARKPLALALLASVLAFPVLLPTEPQEKPRRGPNLKDEPRATSFSLRRAVAFVDDAARDWERQYRCVTCHTNGLYLAARADVSTKSSDYRRARAFAQEYLKRYVIAKEKPSGQRGALEGIVATTCFLTISDMQTNKRLSAITRRALKHMWSVQDTDGAWGDWLKCGWPPFESDDHFGVTLAAIAVGATPPSYRRTPAAKEGVRRLLSWLRAHPPQNLHHKGMMLWAATSLKDIAEAATRSQWTAELLAMQREDGGWRLADLGGGTWKRPKDTMADLPSDAYATAFAVLVLRKAEVPADHERLVRGLHWLRKDQRKSGRWYVRSPKRDGKHFISHAATMLGVMAFRACGERL